MPELDPEFANGEAKVSGLLPELREQSSDDGVGFCIFSSPDDSPFRFPDDPPDHRGIAKFPPHFLSYHFTLQTQY
jgi:hypothetical protein